MSSAKDLGRLLKGLVLVAKEFSSRSPATEDFQTLLKKALVSATDIAGLTRGKARPISNPKEHHSSVVYFARSPPQQQQEEQHPRPVPIILNTVNAASSVPALEEVSSVYTSGSHANNANGDVLVALAPDSSGNHENASGDAGTAPSLPAPVTKKRRPRERRVPSTSFSRALGSPLFSALLLF